MKLNRTLLVAFILSLCWHLFFGLLFTLKLGETATSPYKVISVSYLGKIKPTVDNVTHSVMSPGSVLPPFSLPSLRLIEPPIATRWFSGMMKGILAQTVKRITESSKEVPYPAHLDLETETTKKQEPPWKLPPSWLPKKREDSFIHWEGEMREAGVKYFPPYPQWAKKEGIESEVSLKFWVSPSGRVKKVEVEKSSGYIKLNILAMDYIRKWEFNPSEERETWQVGIITFSFQP